MKNTGTAAGISMLMFVFLMAACSKNPFERDFEMKLPNDAKIAHYKNRSGFVDSSYMMVLSYDGDNVPDIIIQNLKLDKFLSVNGAEAGVISSEWPSWWQPEMIYRIAEVYQRLGRDRFAWFWFDRKNRYIGEHIKASTRAAIDRPRVSLA